jgi:hypothetical protein
MPSGFIIAPTVGAELVGINKLVNDESDVDTVQNFVLRKGGIANRYHVSRRSIDNWMRQGLPYIKIGKSVRFKVSLCDEWLEKNYRVN